MSASSFSLSSRIASSDSSICIKRSASSLCSFIPSSCCLLFSSSCFFSSSTLIAPFCAASSSARSLISWLSFSWRSSSSFVSISSKRFASARLLSSIADRSSSKVLTYCCIIPSSSVWFAIAAIWLALASAASAFASSSSILIRDNSSSISFLIWAIKSLSPLRTLASTLFNDACKNCWKKPTNSCWESRQSLFESASLNAERSSASDGSATARADESVLESAGISDHSKKPLLSTSYNLKCFEATTLTAVGLCTRFLAHFKASSGLPGMASSPRLCACSFARSNSSGTPLEAALS
mmetsp:Transcript_55395/g.154322  ORF Transcript_55395/g.154322 Transcript_55395/m.154322 type:complete len:296 (+) Transcript_55395:174-1061(+)